MDIAASFEAPNTLYIIRYDVDQYNYPAEVSHRIYGYKQLDRALLTLGNAILRVEYD
jgi:hypothetical protein